MHLKELRDFYLGSFLPKANNTFRSLRIYLDCKGIARVPCRDDCKPGASGLGFRVVVQVFLAWMLFGKTWKVAHKATVKESEVTIRVVSFQGAMGGAFN